MDTGFCNCLVFSSFNIGAAHGLSVETAFMISEGSDVFVNDCYYVLIMVEMP